jgi:hypothetical protein
MSLLYLTGMTLLYILTRVFATDEVHIAVMFTPSTPFATQQFLREEISSIIEETFTKAERKLIAKIM